MILIFSNAAHEPTTDSVIDWLTINNAPFVRINSEDIVQKTKQITINPAENVIRIADQQISLSAINVIWYRRWHSYVNIPIVPTNRHEQQLLTELYHEADSILNFLGFILGNKKWLNNPFNNQLHNKLNALYQAKRSGIDTPDTLLTNKKTDLINFYKKHKGAVITKPVADPHPFFDENENNYKAYVEPLTADFIEGLGNEFYLSLFQNKIDAQFEIRVFYLEGSFYATAILNNLNTDIKLSVRREEQIRMISYKLPGELEAKLDSLMKNLSLNSGSIDIIKTVNDKYIFLEVNPIGQFVGYGVPTNYYLEKKVAEWLIKNNHN